MHAHRLSKQLRLAYEWLAGTPQTLVSEFRPLPIAENRPKSVSGERDGNRDMLCPKGNAVSVYKLWKVGAFMGGRGRGEAS